MINKNYTYAIIGASQDESKYGYKVLYDLKQAGFKVIPINPKVKEILGLKVYPNVAEVEEEIDVAIFVVPPAVAEQVIVEVKDKGIKNVWFQPGAGSEILEKYCEENQIEFVNNACIMVQKGKIAGGIS